MPMSPPITLNTARIRSGQIMTGGDSCAWPAASDFRRAEERDEDQPEHVERRQRRHDSAQNEQREAVLRSLREDAVLAEEAAERRHARTAPACRP